MYEKDFVSEEPVEFEIGGRKFAYKRVTAGEENEWINEYLELNIDDETGERTYKQNFTKVNECKIRNIVKVPYDKETINKMIGKDSEWADLDKEQRVQFLKKLTPKLFTEIIKKISDIEKKDDADVDF